MNHRIKSDLNHIASGRPFKLFMKKGNLTPLKRSPRGSDVTWAAHDYNVKYTIHHIEDNRMYFNLPWKGHQVSGWYIDKETGELKDYCTHNMFPKWETYTLEEYGIQLIYKEPEHPVFKSDRRWMETKIEFPDAVIFVKYGDFYEIYHEDALFLHDNFDAILMKGKYARTAIPKVVVDKWTQHVHSKNREVIVITI